MNTTIDESSLTAYALGELSGAQRTAVAAHLVSNEASRRHVAEVRATASLLSDELSRESFGGLTDLQHAAIEQKLDDLLRIPVARQRARKRVRRERVILFMSMAASIAIVCGVVGLLLPFVYNRVQITSRNPQPQPQTLPPIKLLTQRTPSETPSARPNPVLPNPVDSHRPDTVAIKDNPSPEAEDVWVPFPDDALAHGEKGPEDAFEPVALAPRTPLVAPTRKVQVTHGAEHGNDSGTVRPLPLPDQDHNAFVKTPSSSGAARAPAASGDAYAHYVENPFINTSDEATSRFSAGVDTASYSNIRRFVSHGKLPPADSVRIEEMLNYFPLRGNAVAGSRPLALSVEVGACPWRPEHRLARVCVQARELSPLARPPVNLVFVVDISPSMRGEKSKLPLLRQALRLMVGKLSPRDRVSLVAYSQEAGIVLPPTSAEDKQTIWNALERLDSGGQTAGGQGVEVAYDLARRGMIPGGVNRIVLATDGAWSVGATDRSQLASLVREQSRNVSLTVLGVGMSNLKDAMLQSVAAAGGGSYAYIDTIEEAKKVLIDQINGSLVAAARDVKVEVSFNPSAAISYRLIGYERRLLTKDEVVSQVKRGGELGGGQSVTALYEVIASGGKSAATHPTQLLTAVVSYAEPQSLAPRALQTVGEDRATPVPRTSVDYRFSAAVAEFGLLLRDSDYKGNANWLHLMDEVQESTGPDDSGYRLEFASLVRKAKRLATQ